jgi:hypothetical protein
MLRLVLETGIWISARAVAESAEERKDNLWSK